MKEITVITKDRAGVLAEVSDALARKGLNIDSISLETSENKTAVIHIFTKHDAEAQKILSDEGFRVVDSHVLLVRLQDKPGELARMSKLLSDAGLGISDIYMLDKQKNEKVFALKTSNNEKAKTAIADYLA
ncbi:MAG: ACT domain-containing protein [Candidatus Micrarchaeota archaeon]